MARARAGEAEGLWIRAGQQRAGRGRQGRQWTSDPGNVSASTLVRIRPSDPPPPTLALVAAVALHEALDVAAPSMSARIKWPNDLTVDGAKLSGILLERVDDAVVAGFGVNLSSAPVLEDRATVSVAELTGNAPEPAMVVALLADIFARWLTVWRQTGLMRLRPEWLRRAHAVGTALQVRTGIDVLDGLFEGLDPDGGLMLRTVNGIRTVHAGDVFLI